MLVDGKMGMEYFNLELNSLPFGVGLPHIVVEFSLGFDFVTVEGNLVQNFKFEVLLLKLYKLFNFRLLLLDLWIIEHIYFAHCSMGFVYSLILFIYYNLHI